jgi:hypothetical protein
MKTATELGLKFSKAQGLLDSALSFANKAHECQ